MAVKNSTIVKWNRQLSTSAAARPRRV
jgi:hypothetical protein